MCFVVRCVWSAVMLVLFFFLSCCGFVRCVLYLVGVLVFVDCHLMLVLGYSLVVVCCVSFVGC